MSELSSCFKAYDVRGKVPDEFNVDIAYSIGRAYAKFLKPTNVVVGRDIRLSGGAICRALTNGLLDSGVNVFDIGICGTEQIYFATYSEKMDGGIMVTASHNPAEYNGFKITRENGLPVGQGTGMEEIKDFVQNYEFEDAETKGGVEEKSVFEDYKNLIFSLVSKGICLFSKNIPTSFRLSANK